MFSELEMAELRFEQMGARMEQGAIEPSEYAAFMKEYRALEVIIEKYREYKALQASEADALELLASGDEELKALAKEELREVKEKLPTVTEELQILLLPKDPLDEKNVMVEIRACAGGEEAALFAAVLYRMYGMYCDAAGRRDCRS